MATTKKFYETEAFPVLLFILVILFTAGAYRSVVLACCLVYMLGCMLLRFAEGRYALLENSKSELYSLHSWKGSMVLVCIIFVFCVCLVGVGVLWGTAHIPQVAQGIQWRLFKYPVFALVQELVLVYFLRRLQESFGSSLAVQYTALYFALCHLPNPFLVPLTWVMGYVFAKHYLRYKNIVGLWVGHVMLGASVSAACSEQLTSGMRAGLACIEFWSAAGR